MFEVYSQPPNHLKLFLTGGFSNTSASKWVKIGFLAQFAFTEPFTALSCPKLKSLDASGQWMIRAETRGDMKKLMACVRH